MGAGTGAVRASARSMGGFMKRYIRWLAAAALVALTLACQLEAPVADMDEVPNFAAVSKTIGINVLLNTAPTDAILAELALHGTVLDRVPAINALTMQGQGIGARGHPRPAVCGCCESRSGAERRTDRHGIRRELYRRPVDLEPGRDQCDGLRVRQPAGGVRRYRRLRRRARHRPDRHLAPVLPPGTDRRRVRGSPSAAAAAKSAASRPSPTSGRRTPTPTARTSRARSSGIDLGGTPVNGVAPMATVIPVKVLNQNGSGWSSVVARGIIYVADLKAGPLADHPVVINMSLGGPNSTPWRRRPSITPSPRASSSSPRPATKERRAWGTPERTRP